MSAAQPRRGAPIRSISAIVPVYNEVSNLGPLVEAAADALHDAVPEYEILLVDDGSDDGTAQLADDLALRVPGVRTLHHAGNRGYGAAVRTGLREATRQFVLLLDADRQYDPAEIARLVQWGDQYDLVAAYRLRRAAPFPRRLLGAGARLLDRLLFGVRLRDPNAGLKLIRGQLFKEMDLQSSSAVIQPEILARARLQGASIHEVGVRHYPRRAERHLGLRLSARARARVFGDVIALRRRLRRERRSASTGRPENDPASADPTAPAH